MLDSEKNNRLITHEELAEVVPPKRDVVAQESPGCIESLTTPEVTVHTSSIPYIPSVSEIMKAELTMSDKQRSYSRNREIDYLIHRRVGSRAYLSSTFYTTFNERYSEAVGITLDTSRLPQDIIYTHRIQPRRATNENRANTPFSQEHSSPKADIKREEAKTQASDTGDTPNIPKQENAANVAFREALNRGMADIAAETSSKIARGELSDRARALDSEQQQRQQQAQERLDAEFSLSRTRLAEFVALMQKHHVPTVDLIDDRRNVSPSWLYNVENTHYGEVIGRGWEIVPIHIEDGIEGETVHEGLILLENLRTATTRPSNENGKLNLGYCNWSYTDPVSSRFGNDSGLDLLAQALIRLGVSQ